ncbi:MAG: site-specific integrase [Gammaproteobacteria bacterium]|nr:site-specific integrase [Gammaproteobacteria bacterium]
MDYDAAKKAAEAWLASMSGSAAKAPRRGTVRAALEAYLAYLRQQGRGSTAVEVESRYKALVWPDELASAELEDLTIDDLLAWRERLRKRRLNRSVNRHVRAVTAGLNKAHRLGHVGNPAAWRVEALADDVEEAGETAVMLSPEQRTAVIKVASAGLADFLRGLEFTGARPGELAAATVADFDGSMLKLSHRKGRSGKLRSRYVMLSDDGVRFFKAQGRRKLPAAPIFTEDGEQPWRRHRWARAINAAIEGHNRKARGKARVPPEASAYSFRHSRISELLQLYGIDPLTVAQQTGTSLAMIEKAYFKFIPSAMREKLAAVK